MKTQLTGGGILADMKSLRCLAFALVMLLGNLPSGG